MNAEHCTCVKPEPALMDNGLSSLCEKCYRPIVPLFSKQKMQLTRYMEMSDPNMRESPHGEWVRYEDVAALLDGNAAETEIEQLRGALQMIAEGVSPSLVPPMTPAEIATAALGGCSFETKPRHYMVRGRFLPLSENGVLMVGLDPVPESTHEVVIVDSQVYRAEPETKAEPDPRGLAVVRAAQLDLAAKNLDRHDCHSLGEACREAAALLRGFAGVSAQKTNGDAP